MPLTSFGSILTFSEEIETQDMAFYSDVVGNPECTPFKSLFEQFIKECQKNIVIIQRTRRENVTEMILEPVSDFVRAPFCIEKQNGNDISTAKILEIVKTIEQRSLDYYTKASEKMRPLPEVSNALKLLAKKHTARLKKVNDI
ncbi:MAG: hypothetical protein KKE44_07010 [Proteobacteria bacterium]|nr:hypothetical protein [Pseudomonadota bacterium]MBU1582479.1 hypothetical protein [Pseudomonadota bacterium]MBU2630621.1 hypothetical protein [Pseudomonadota bacterium]